MLIIPAIDLKNGKCVRLRQGREEEITEYSSDPVATAAGFLRLGARRLHLVNLDGAFGYSSENGGIMRRVAALPGVEVQFGGGLRTAEGIDEALAAGAARVVIGTVAVENPGLVAEAIAKHSPRKVIVAVDAFDGKVAIKGWKVTSALSVRSVARSVKRMGVEEVLYTDISRDGMMSGPDLRSIERLAEEGLRVYASGGISSVEDIKALKALGSPHVIGVIVGKALYEGKVSLEALLEAAED